MSSTLEAKIVILGSQGVGKTSLVTRYCKGAFDPAKTTSTVGASFMTKRVVDTDTDTLVRLQIWDTAGQERFRSISRLYYRGANACILCYSITDSSSFHEMSLWLTELRRNLPSDIILHVVGTKADIVARDPSKRQVPFERCIAYVAENLAPGRGSTPPPSAAIFDPPSQPPIPSSNPRSSGLFSAISSSTKDDVGPKSPSSKRSSGFWGQEVGWDACHEISAESGEGVEEVFRVVTRKLVERDRKMRADLLAASGGRVDGQMFGGPETPFFSSVAATAGTDGEDGQQGGGGGGYFDHRLGGNGGGSFRVGRDRRSWLFSPGFSTPGLGTGTTMGGMSSSREGGEGEQGGRGGRCC
ncbi:putative rab GTPase [Cercophora samala]|uniref:Rab GTPase n=1 Tax=Cercophora samala TaxID=330535 RepID=A0AA39ZJM6_9PEZI|nr:putative rab GTPase [Cercophora samala]